MRWRDGPPSVWWKQCCNSLFASFRLRVNRSNMLQLNFYFVKLDVSGRFWHIHVPSCTYFMLMILLGKKKWSAGWSTCRNSPDLIESLLLGRLNDFVEGKEVRLGNLDLICVNEPGLVEPVPVALFYQYKDGFPEWPWIQYVWVAWIMRNLYCTMGFRPRQRLSLGGGRSWSHVGSLATVPLSWFAQTKMLRCSFGWCFDDVSWFIKRMNKDE